MSDLPRESGTIYAARTWSGRYVPLSYGEAWERWHAGSVIYTKDGNGTRTERAARPWVRSNPPA